MMKRRDFGRSKLTFTFNSLSWLLAVLLLALWPWTGAMAQTCVAPPSGLVSWWPGEGNANDIQGTNNGTITGTTFATGKVGQAFSFDGNDYVQVLDSASLEPAKVTLDAWVKRSGSPGTYRYIVTKGGYDCSNASYALYTGGGGGLQFYISPAPGSFRLSPAALTSQVWDGNWHHVAGTYDGTSVRLYLDGAEIGSGTATTVSIGYSFPNDDFYMGRFGISSCLSGLYFSGQIDEVEVFNRALSASEISAIYNAGSAGKCTWIQVGIDIKPGSFPNSINLGSNGVVPVAILSSATFDATTVNPTTVELAGASVALKGKGTLMYSLQDVDLDGDTDMVVHVSTQSLVLNDTDTVAELTGETSTGQKIKGTDTIRVVP